MRPSFVKIDVEGHELRVLEGFSVPVGAVSFEFAADYLGSARPCVRRLAEVGRYRFHYSVHEAMRLELSAWVGRGDFVGMIDGWNPGSVLLGATYARCERG